MNHSRGLNNKINRLHGRCLRIIYDDKCSNFEELLNKDNSVSIHNHNIQALAIELYKVANDMSPEVISGVFQVRDTLYYNLRNNSQKLIQFIVFIAEWNQHLIWDQRFGNKFLLKLEIKNPLIVLKEKSKNGNQLIVHAEFVKRLCPI